MVILEKGRFYQPVKHIGRYEFQDISRKRGRLEARKQNSQDYAVCRVGYDCGDATVFSASLNDGVIRRSARASIAAPTPRTA